MQKRKMIARQNERRAFALSSPRDLDRRHDVAVTSRRGHVQEWWRRIAVCNRCSRRCLHLLMTSTTCQRRSRDHAMTRSVTLSTRTHTHTHTHTHTATRRRRLSAIKMQKLQDRSPSTISHKLVRVCDHVGVKAMLYACSVCDTQRRCSKQYTLVALCMCFDFTFNLFFCHA